MIKFIIFIFGVTDTNYIIFDLEFNSTKIPSSKKGFNEIIEIGSVKLNSSLDEIDSFSMTVKPKFSKKLNQYTKNLTHITEEELSKSKSFKSVIKEFEQWCNVSDDICFLSWSDTDLHVIAENFNEILGKDKVDFIDKYVDLQKYVMSLIPNDNNNQISLKAAAEHFDINTDNFEMHRAKDDSKVCGKILKITYSEKFNSYIRYINNNDFYKKLLFKPYIIEKLQNIPEELLYIECPICKNRIKYNGKFNPKTKSFSSIIKCKNCKNKIAVNLRCKKTYDNISVSKKIKTITKKKPD